jgi:hypothetical protein
MVPILPIYMLLHLAERPDVGYAILPKRTPQHSILTDLARQKVPSIRSIVAQRTVYARRTIHVHVMSSNLLHR